MTDSPYSPFLGGGLPLDPQGYPLQSPAPGRAPTPPSLADMGNIPASWPTVGGTPQVSPPPAWQAGTPGGPVAPSAQFGYEQYLQLQQQSAAGGYQQGYPYQQPPYPVAPPTFGFPPAAALAYPESDVETTGQHPILAVAPQGPATTASSAAPTAEALAGPSADALAELPPPAVAGAAQKSSLQVRNVAFFRVLRSEWIKLRTLPSTWWLLTIATALTVGMGALMGWTIKLAYENPESVGMPPEMAGAFEGMSATVLATAGMQFMQLVVTILGVLYITNEYSSGSISATLTAVPTRTVVLVSKAINLAVTVFTVSMIALYGAALLGWTFISGHGVDDRFTLEGLRIIAGASLANTLITLFAFAVGALLRSTAAGMGAVICVLMVLPIIVQILPWNWAATAGTYLPSESAAWLYSFDKESLANLWTWNQWGFLKGLWVTGAWALVPRVGAVAALKTRDARSGE
jgi:ABC-2 type transport system permease protein